MRPLASAALPSPRPWRNYSLRLAGGAGPAALAALAGTLATAALTAAVVVPRSLPSGVPLPDLVRVGSGTFSYRASGEFSRGGRPVAAPMVNVAVPPLAVMRHQVTASDYERCTVAGACPVLDQQPPVSGWPVVKVSWRDAAAYAAWLSRATRSSLRLPTDAEWAYAAAERWQDDGLPDAAHDGDPGRRALARYELEASRKSLDSEPQPTGSFGVNDNGLVDVAGNVWEWTTTCFERTALAAGGEAAATTRNCGVRVVEGRHRAYIPDFIRDARGGGCSAGIPPSNLGFRLVRDEEN
jgi:formylglycine-generating enzyme required for sulfatase activity